MNCDDAIRTVAERLGLPFELCKRAYASQWVFIRETIKSLPLKEMPAEDLHKYKTNFNVTSLGKFAILQRDFEGKKRMYEQIKLIQAKNDKSKGNQASVQSDSGDAQDL